ncbi:MAG: DNA polymerase III subunit beta [Sediminibacterium sp. Gen4]|jgi:DNA polymerase III subunit beta|uniref:DNA polymerase III subunit beta n=1 Tax=unclassified Sediminibacterium TaxID=2635961 RepID=UPI0015B8C788|nr:MULTISPECIES: DNA polymerase III subunit beta [unclassified Sediminibacterium]MBW0160784.1 DNA polymerase III subunit beta [Sediminibacterium sp.]MBW0165074.1 DNA polymerase III subunit beta [Sediminibacterium sp.]NWK64528.1 DNA polymerase III subunit beta [Sediminibacterium sp. Gen4]
MKFIVSSSSLLKHLQQISGVINANTVLPILEDFLFEIQDKKLSVVATDLETVMRVQMDVESKANGKVCIPAKILMDSLKNIADQPLTFNIDKNFAVEITSDNGKYKVMGENPDNFPKEPAADDTTGFDMTSSGLLTAINKTLFAVSNDDLRPAMTGVFFELSKDGVQFVATDAHRLVRYKRTDAHASKTDSFIVPKKPLNLLKNALPDNDDAITVSYNSNHLFVNHGSTQMICRLIDARFPDYKVVIPADNPYKLIVNKADFQNALRRVNVFSNKSTNQVALSITGSELQMAAQDIDFSFEGNERMSCQYDGEDLQIAFNAKFLIEMLSAADTEDVKMELSTPTKAGLIKPTEQAEGEDLLMLVMPLMLNN